MSKFIRVSCSKPVALSETLRLDKILDRYRLAGFPSRFEARFYWNDLSGAEFWAENCLAAGGKAKIWLVEVDAEKCVECDFLPVEVLAEDGRLSEEEVEKWARRYWSSCRRPGRLGEVGNTEVLCWNVREEKKTLLAEVGNLKELRKAFAKIREKILQH